MEPGFHPAFSSFGNLSKRSANVSKSASECAVSAFAKLKGHILSITDTKHTKEMWLSSKYNVVPLCSCVFLDDSEHTIASFMMPALQWHRTTLDYLALS